MNLPLIRVDENGFHFIHKNFINIYRYQANNRNKINLPKFRNYRSLASKLPFLSNSTKNISKISLFEKDNNSIYKINQRNKRFNHFIENNDIKNKKQISFSDNSFDSTQNKIKKLISFFSNSNKISSIGNEQSKNNIDNKNKTQSIVFNTNNIKKSFSEQKISKTNEKENNFPNKSYIKSLKSKYILNNIDKILTKFKINKLIEKKTKQYCLSFENKNQLFNEKILNTLISEKFINSQIKKKRNFIFGKSENSFNKLNKYIKEIDNQNKFKNEYSLEEIIRSLNEKDLKILLSDITYFRDINKNIVNVLKKIKDNKNLSNSLVQVLNEEDGIKIEKEEDNNEKSNQEDEIKYKLKIFHNYEKFINKKINKDLNRRLRNINNKKKNNDIEVENINICELKAKSLEGKQIIKYDEYCEDACFRSFFNNINYNMTKKYILDRNYERLLKEDSFKKIRNKTIKLKKEDEEIVLKYLNTFKKINNK